MVKIIYFDYHGVLDRRHFHGLLEVMAKTAKAPDVVAFMSQLEPYTYAYASGSINPSVFWPTIEREYGAKVSAAGKAYTLHVDPVREMWVWLNQLKSKVAVGLCTDCALDKKQVILHAYDLPTFFETLIFSCDVGTTKRDVAFYKLLDQYGTYRPDECLLIDDQGDNVAMAQALGIPAYQHRNAAETIAYIEPLLS